MSLTGNGSGQYEYRVVERTVPIGSDRPEGPSQRTLDVAVRTIVASERMTLETTEPGHHGWEVDRYEPAYDKALGRVNVKITFRRRLSSP